MEKRLLVFCCLLLLAISAGSIYFLVKNPGIRDTMEVFSSNPSSAEDVSVMSLVKPEIKRIGDDESPHDMSFEFPKNVDIEEIKFSLDYFENTFEMTVQGIDELYFNSFPVSGNSDRIDDITFAKKQAEGKIKLKFNKITTVNSVTKGRYLYLDFYNPDQYFDKVVVLDPGCGGDDFGIVVDGVYEKDLNLSICKKVVDLFEQEKKIGLFCTRLSDIGSNIDERIAFSNMVNANMYISIHQNSTASGRESDINGAQVQYFSADPTGESKELATALISNITGSLECKNMGAVAGDNNIIFQKNKSPTAIINVGYMTNKEELEHLMDDDYQNKCAKAIYTTIMEKMYENSNSDR